MFLTCVALVYALFAATSLGAEAPAELPVFDVPQIAKHAISAEPWGETGFRVDLMPDDKGNVRAISEFDAKFRLAWNDDGLLILLTVRSNLITEADKLDELWSRDSFEIFLAERPGAAEICHVMVSPGCDPAHPEVRTYWNPAVKAPVLQDELRITVARKKMAGGYQAEVFLPWNNLKLAPKLNDRVAFQLMVNSYDDRRKALFNGVWFPVSDTSRNSKSMHIIQLSNAASPAVGFTATAAYERFRSIRLIASAGEFAAGKTIVVSAGGKRLLEAPLKSSDGRASADVLLPMPEPGVPTLPLEVAVDGRTLKTLVLPDADVFRAEALAYEKITCENYCFGTRAFPRCDFEHPDLVEKLIGPYTVSCVYYGADGTPVTTAEKPGRYAAVVEVTPAAGRSIRRFCTLFRYGDKFTPRAAEATTTLTLSEDTGIGRETLEKRAVDISAYMKTRFVDSLARDPGSAALFASLHDLSAGNPNASVPTGDLRQVERQWWVNFKRRYYGYDKLHPNAFVCPKPLAGPEARTIRSGSLADAGIKPAAAEKLDALCREWEKATGEPFSVCLVRHGVIFFESGYGQRNGKALTTGTPVQTASSAKFLASILMMEMVDQGLIDLDKTIDQYIPALRNLPCKRPLTVRDLYLHVTGLPQRLGDPLSDIEETVASNYPYITDARHVYQATGLALGGKIVEMISGEVHPAFWQKHLLDPLGCKDSKPGGTSGGATTTALDYAIIGQMMLNGGAYGKWRFMNEQTVRQFAPQPGNDRVGPDKKIRWGIGTKLYDSDHLSARAFGHSGANGEFLLVDPEYDFAAAMTRFTEGNDYLKFRGRLFATVFENIADQQEQK